MNSVMCHSRTSTPFCFPLLVSERMEIEHGHHYGSDCRRGPVVAHRVTRGVARADDRIGLIRREAGAPEVQLELSAVGTHAACEAVDVADANEMVDNPATTLHRVRRSLGAKAEIQAPLVVGELARLGSVGVGALVFFTTGAVYGASCRRSRAAG